jgi:imidazoleglycerol phosphate dehydratase HisB
MLGVDIDTKKNTVSVDLNTKIYKLETILKVAQTFTEACWVSVGGEVEGAVQVKLKPKSKDISTKKIGYEFLNHVLAQMKISEDTRAEMKIFGDAR